MSPSPPPLLHAVLCYLCLKSLERKKIKGDIGPSGNFFLTSSPFYANISRCWDTGCSSSFLSHFKVYWLCRRWKLHSRLLELKAICLPFDQTQILFCQIKCIIRQILWAGFHAAAHTPYFAPLLALCNMQAGHFPSEVFFQLRRAPLSSNPVSNLMKAWNGIICPHFSV